MYLDEAFEKSLWYTKVAAHEDSRVRANGLHGFLWCGDLVRIFLFPIELSIVSTRCGRSDRRPRGRSCESLEHCESFSESQASGPQGKERRTVIYLKAVK